MQTTVKRSQLSDDQALQVLAEASAQYDNYLSMANVVSALNEHEELEADLNAHRAQWTHPMGLVITEGSR